MAIMQVNPYSAEVRYSVRLMVQHLMADRPRSIRIASHSAEMVKSVVRHVCYDDIVVLVDTPSIQTAIADTLGVAVEVVQPDSTPAEAALFPFSLEEGARPNGEQRIVVACWNALSYKSLLHPGTVPSTVLTKMAQLKPRYGMRPVASLYSPRFIVWLTLAKLMERWNSAWYFQLEDRAMQHFVNYGPLWRLSYIVIIAGREASHR